ncbi:hypothetical protein ACF081_23585 [Streptomyces longwoodensis]|uniref:hypothetical protein n=1 Tax=Streptomyces longwoodensis TaxID=68231 RepID=UPI0036F88705
MRQTSDLPTRGAISRAALSSVLGAVLTVSLSACSGESGDGEDATLTAAQVCDATLDSPAAASLKRMGATDKFKELPGTNEAGEPNRFSLKRAATGVNEGPAEQDKCTVFTSTDESGHPLIEVSFTAEGHAPTPDASAEPAGSVLYPIGVYAKTNAKNSATIYFRCPTKDLMYVNASLYSAPDQTSPKTTDHDLMVVLNSVSRALAKQLGCTSQADLPAQVTR